MGSTLHRYIFLQLLGPFVAGLALFTFVLLIARILKLIELVMNRGASLAEILRLFAFILPAFLEVTVPMSLLLACLLACGRMSADSEIIAMRSGGLSLYQIAMPIWAFAIAAWLCTLGLSLYARPWGNAALKAGIFDLARRRATVGLQENVFNDDFEGLVIYVEEIEPPGTALQRILISDRRTEGEENTVIAKRGRLLADEHARAVNLRLFDGVIFTRKPDGRDYQRTDFSIYDVSLDLAKQLRPQPGSPERDPSSMSTEDLRSRIKSVSERGEPDPEDRAELERRYSVPFAALVFALIAVPLGVQPVRAVRARGLAVSLAVILGYYVLLSAAEALGRQGRAPVALALWTPNVALGLLGLALFLHAASERPMPGAEQLSNLLRRIVRRLPLPRSAK